MELESHQIPKSYQSYLEQFETDPEKAISRLKTRIEKRNTGSVGYFFLAWLHLKNNNKEKALDAAINAKIMAPGSRFMGRLPYFIQHPHAFDAWQPKKMRVDRKREYNQPDQAYPIQDLDLLISKLSSIERRRYSESDLKNREQHDLSKESVQVEDIVSETLAVIHEKQENYSAAIKTYKRLLSETDNSSKKEHYQKQIDRIKKVNGDEKKGVNGKS